MKTTFSTVLTGLFSASMGVFLLFGCDDDEGGVAGHTAKTAPIVTATRIEAAVMSTSTLAANFSRPGEVEAGREAGIASALGGRIERVAVEVGAAVVKGQVLAKVDSRLLSAQVVLAKVEVEDARREFRRLESMGNNVASVRIDEARTRVARVEAQLKIAKIQASKTTLVAPFAGTVAVREMERGEIAAPGMVLAKIVSLDPALVSVSVADRDVGGLSAGMRADVLAVGAPNAIEGRIRRIEPTADLKTRSFVVEVEVPNSDNALRPGMIANVRFHGVVHEDRIVLPQEFLVTKLNSNGVFVVDDDDIARWRPVRLGTMIREQVIIEEGLKSGDKIVVLGHRALSDGDPLIVARLGECCEDGRVRHSTTDDVGETSDKKEQEG